MGLPHGRDTEMEPDQTDRSHFHGSGGAPDAHMSVEDLRELWESKLGEAPVPRSWCVLVHDEADLADIGAMLTASPGEAVPVSEATMKGVPVFIAPHAVDKGAIRRVPYNPSMHEWIRKGLRP